MSIYAGVLQQPLSRGVSATALRNALRAVHERVSGGGGRLNEGARRVLDKLDRVTQAGGLHRAYVKNGQRVTLWDLLSADDLSRRGYVQAHLRPCSVFSEATVKNDRITCWTSQLDPVAELWIGEPLLS